MKLVIDIGDYIFDSIVGHGIGSVDAQHIEHIIMNGTPYEERPKGKWIEGEYGNIKCNRCGCEIIYSYLIGNKSDFPKFCCDCGADMRGDL